MLDSEWFSGAANSGHDFVGNQKDVVIAADFGNALNVTIRRSGSAKRGSHDRLKDKRRDCCRTVRTQQRIEVISAGDIATGKSFAEGTVVAETGSDVAPLGQKRRIRRAAGDIAADGHGAKGAPVITLAARDNTKFVERAAFEMKLTRELDGCFGGFRAARSEIDAAVCEILRRKSKKASGKLFGGSGVELCRVRESDLRGLRGHGIGDGLHAVADANDGGLTRSVEIFFSIRRENPGAFPANGIGEGLLETPGEESGGVCGHGRDCSKGSNRGG